MTTVAVIGGGAAGIGAAKTLVDAGVQVLLLESAPRLGGNCLGIEVRGEDGRAWTIDAGVSDFNRRTFPFFSALLDELGLPTQPIRTDASFATPDGRPVALCRAGSWWFDPHLVRDPIALQAEIERFRREAPRVLDDDGDEACSFGDWLRRNGWSRTLAEVWALPRAAGCFPMPDRSPEGAPARELIAFWLAHGVVGTAPADRRCVRGGMHLWPARFARWFVARGGELLCGTRVLGIARDRRSCRIRVVDRDDRHRTITVDHAVLAGHARDSLQLLDDATQAEIGALGRFARQRARLVVHRDPRLVGGDAARAGAFHYVVPSAAGGLPRVRPTITFSPKQIASLPAEAPDVFVTMNPHLEPHPEAIVCERYFVHPIASRDQVASAARVHAVQGVHRTWFAGSWLRAPHVHESALVSGIHAAAQCLRRARRRSEAQESLRPRVPALR